jgi:hypothetical protein
MITSETMKEFIILMMMISCKAAIHQFIFANVTRGVFLYLVYLYNDHLTVLASKSQ